jgi:hypothetical protein
VDELRYISKVCIHMLQLGLRDQGDLVLNAPLPNIPHVQARVGLATDYIMHSLLIAALVRIEDVCTCAVNIKALHRDRRA